LRHYGQMHCYRQKQFDLGRCLLLVLIHGLAKVVLVWFHLLKNLQGLLMLRQ